MAASAPYAALKPASVASFAANGLWAAMTMAGDLRVARPPWGARFIVFAGGPVLPQVMTPMVRMIRDGAVRDWRQSRPTLFAQRKNS